eukprot:CAMPEP_0175834526 /NCGR_PEP_ID=MMETSP0107_2-20121207/16103_1 /TAXON_ID=195067 ORGANISM="Goniomonas pacifica, Strain CCMP1869" /NCGR_SAMPLE_ID=MMETSP0107_2 /ASSEMBLY_ACC=CAM_ASM_000203 /LENGTH=160 /DNA_ID=CAMNT_0017147753 /DNA_START=276 /DNA_END=755 /DNA_ORIENTATION=+
MTVLSLNTHARNSPAGLDAIGNLTQWLCPQNLHCSTPLSVDHSLTVLSFDVDARSLPLGLNTIHSTGPLWPWRVDSPTHTSTLVSADQSLIVLPDADARSLPSGLKATELTRPCSVDTFARVSIDHSRIVSSQHDADARSVLSGLNATDLTRSRCPFSVD